MRIFGSRSGKVSARKQSRVRLSVELLEDRLALAWSGIPPAMIGIPTAVSVSLNNQADASGTAAITNNEVDYYRFTATSTGEYILRATTPSSNLDTVIGIFSSTGLRLGFNDDMAVTNTDSQTKVQLTAGTVYYFGVTNYTGTSGGSYNWLIDGPTAPPPDDAYEDNDTQAQAYNLGNVNAPKTVTALALADSADWYRFTTAYAGTSANSVAISFQNSQGDLTLELFNSAGTRLGISNTTANTEQLSLNGLAAGTYFVKVTGNGGVFNPSYSLLITPPTTPPTPPTPPPTTSGFQIDVVFGAGLSTSQRAAFQQAAARWSQIIIGDIPNATYQGQVVDDVRIDASGVAIDGAYGILGQAGPDQLRPGSYLPIHGVMQFDTADLAMLEQSGQLVDVIVHEMGHVLGIGTIWQLRGLVSGAGTSNPTFTGANARTEYNAIFGTNATGVPVENTGGAGTQDSHWRESVFGAELMTGYLNSGVANPISRVTIASLADLGYSVNLAAANAYSKPASLRILPSRPTGNSGSNLLSDGQAPGSAGGTQTSAPSNSVADQIFQSNTLPGTTAGTVPQTSSALSDNHTTSGDASFVLGAHGYAGGRSQNVFGSIWGHRDSNAGAAETDTLLTDEVFSL